MVLQKDECDGVIVTIPTCYPYKEEYWLSMHYVKDSYFQNVTEK